MFGGSGKIGRGGGSCSGGKRNVHAPPINRAGRLSMVGGPRGRGAASSSVTISTSSSMQAEESFSLVRENPLNFAMAIKLAPDLVEEIKRVEAQGGSARIKFDANAKNSNGNIIRVGDKHFKFTWSKEPGDLCDIYEERRSGEDGNGLLIESGGTWRKLNVERELDELTKNHVKRRSEEAERKYKSRKAIILDPQNPVTQTQKKALAAAESTPWKNFKNRKEPPFKKPKSEPPSVGPPKSVHKSVSSTTTPSKGKFSSGSPLSSQLEQHVAPISPGRGGNFVKGRTSFPDVAPTKTTKTANSDKEMHARLPGGAVHHKFKLDRNTEVKPPDVRNLLVSLLLESRSAGLTLKNLEKASGDAMPNSSRQIEPILKQIAIYQTPGKYFLKPGVEMESFMKPHSQSGRSPEFDRYPSPAIQRPDQLPAEDPNFYRGTATNDEEQGPLNSTPGHATDATEKIDILGNSPDHLIDKKVSENSEGMAGSSDSGSDSDSDSDSSDTGSDSGSHNRRQSPRAGTSSDSESDASSSSKQASDEEVDIMSSDDENESKQKLRDFDPIPSKSPIQWRHYQDNESVPVENSEKQDDRVYDVVEIEKDSPEDNNEEAERAAVNYSIPAEDPFEVIKPSSPDHTERQEREVSERKSYGRPYSVVNDDFKHGPSSHERLTKGKFKRHHDDKHSDERTENKKRLKSKNLSLPVSGTINSLFGESPCTSPDRPSQGLDEGLMLDKATIDNTSDPNLPTCFNQGVPNRAALYDYQQPDQRSFGAIGHSESLSGERKSDKIENFGLVDKYSEQNLQMNDGLLTQKGSNADEDGLLSDRRQTKFSAEVVGNKPATTQYRYRKPEMLGNLKETGDSPEDINASTTGSSTVINGQASVLRREQSDLELGEFREPSTDEIPAPKKKFERKSSLKQSESKDSDYWNTDLSRGKPSSTNIADLRKLSPPNAEAVGSVPDGPSKRKASEHYVDDLTRPNQKTTRPLHQYHQSRGDYIEAGSQHIKVPDMSSKSRYTEAGTVSGTNSETYVDTSRKVYVNSKEQQHENSRGYGSPNTKESKKQKPIIVGDSNGRQKDASLTGSNDGSLKKRESCSDENSCAYTKYDKEEPELKGPIKDATQYKEYVKEYQEKYESYCSLNKILDLYRDEFSKFGKDLESYKVRDMKRYHDILGQMRSSFRRSGERHKRLKKIFVVLYEELKHLKQMIKDFAASYKKE